MKFKDLNLNISMIERLKHKLIDSKFNQEQIETIINIVKDFLPDKRKKNNVVDLLKYIEKKYQKKYGEDEIFISFPVPAKLRIKLSEFKKINNISYDKYCKFGEWLIECSGEEMSVYNLIEQKLYNKFLNNYKDDKEIINRKREVVNPKLLRFKLSK